MRQIVLDTETTGLDPNDGHRIIEIGCVELIDRRLTGNNFQQYLQPDRDMDPGAIEVHGISNDFLRDKPRFADIVTDFLRYIDGSELVIHNAAFDIGFLDAELKRIDENEHIGKHCQVLDTLLLARQTHPGKRNSLDALCKRYAIDNSHRTLHGALLDAEILAEVYLAMTGGQSSLELAAKPENQLFDADEMQGNAAQYAQIVIKANASENAAHQQLRAQIKTAHGFSIWDKLENNAIYQDFINNQQAELDASVEVSEVDDEIEDSVDDDSQYVQEEF